MGRKKPAIAEEDDDVTATAVTGTLLTVTLALPDCPPKLAVIVTLPAATPVTWPVLNTVASLLLEDTQVAWPVTS
jgi:hypothetical protein